MHCECVHGGVLMLHMCLKQQLLTMGSINSPALLARFSAQLWIKVPMHSEQHAAKLHTRCSRVADILEHQYSALHQDSHDKLLCAT